MAQIRHHTFMLGKAYSQHVDGSRSRMGPTGGEYSHREVLEIRAELPAHRRALGAVRPVGTKRSRNLRAIPERCAVVRAAEKKAARYCPAGRRKDDVSTCGFE